MNLSLDHLQLGKIPTLGSSHRTFVPIKGGTVTGPRLSGAIISTQGSDSHPYAAGGGDWQTLTDNGTLELLAKYFIMTDDGVIINVENRGIGRVREPATEAKGTETAGGKRYVRMRPTFEVQEGSKHEWMNSTLFLGQFRAGGFAGNHITIDVFEVL